MYLLLLAWNENIFSNGQTMCSLVHLKDWMVILFIYISKENVGYTYMSLSNVIYNQHNNIRLKVIKWSTIIRNVYTKYQDRQKS